MEGLSIKASSTTVCTEKKSATQSGDDSVGVVTHSVDRVFCKTVKTVVNRKTVSTTIANKAAPSESECADEWVSTVESLVVEIIGEIKPASVTKRGHAADNTGAGNVNGRDDACGEAASGPVCQDETIVGSGDRAYYLSLKFANIAVALRQEPIGKTELITPRRPLSRAECHRRCGKAGFCDPASDLGCGGEYCGNLQIF